MGEAQTGDRLVGARTSRRAQAAHAVRGDRHLAGRALGFGAFHDARSSEGTGRARRQDRASRRVELRAGTRPELQKKPYSPAEQDRPDVARRRARWKARQATIDPARLVFIDETWVKTNMTPLRGWGPRGQRLVAKAPHGHWKTLTFVAALRCDRIEAPLRLRWPYQRPKSSPLYVEQALAPTLNPGDIVVLDNLGSRTKAPCTRDASAPSWRPAFLPAALQPRSQSHRAGLRQTQTPHAQRRRAHRRDDMATHRLNPARLLARRMRKLSQELRICFRMKAAGSGPVPCRAQHVSQSHRMTPHTFVTPMT